MISKVFVKRFTPFSTLFVPSFFPVFFYTFFGNKKEFICISKNYNLTASFFSMDMQNDSFLGCPQLEIKKMLNISALVNTLKFKF